jgi:hypothetical protein
VNQSSLWRIFLCVILLSTFAFGRSDFDELAERVNDSYAAQLHDQDPLIAEINARSLSVNRVENSGDDLVRIKYLLSQWRFGTRNHLLQQAAHSADAYAAALTQLNQLGVLLGKPEIETLLALQHHFVGAVTQTDFENLLVSHGDPASVKKVLSRDSINRRLLVPATSIGQVPMLPHPWWRSQGWLSVQDADAYVWDGECVRVRGTRICTGDVLLVDLAKIFDGINTSFSEPRSSFTHNGVVTFLEIDGRKIPAVFEIHGAGMRIVPLARYLSPQFIYYGEVYRPNADVHRPADYDSRLSKLVMRILDEQIGYDFNARPIPEGGYDAMVECDQVGVVCSGSLDMLNRSLDIPVKVTPSHLASGARRNVASAGLELLAERGTYLTPSDFKFSPDYVQVGTIDNNFQQNLVREWMMGSPLVEGSFGHRMNTQTLNVSNLPFWKGGAIYKVVNALSQIAHAPKPISSVFFAFTNALVGLSRKTLPQAPGKTLASVVALNNRIEAAGKALLKCPEVLLAANERQAFDLSVSENSPAVRGRVNSQFTRVGLDQAFE